ncbi:MULTISPECIES: hypothetical protein [Pseudomonas]|uniref:hypothetical protein n=1 Tax=Pseudomonas TaxID=286 RepID=UPI000F016D48|nr:MULTISPECIES: hypothetical protein [Pseudomonas]MBD8681716.1 hypothetical protein [Pseudomonas sp. CFBP 13719]
MKKSALALLALLASQSAFSDNIIKTYAPIKGASSHAGQWAATDAMLSDWAKSGDLYDCSAATPATDAYVKGVSFQQTLSNCSQDYTRSVQPREINSVTGMYRNVGNPTEEDKTESGLGLTQQAVGTREEKDILFGGREGRAYLTSTNTSYVGMYSRATPAPAASIGDVQYTKEGDRIQMYFTMAGKPSASSGTCYVKVGATGVNGWDANLTPTSSAKAYVTAITKVTTNYADGSTRIYTLGGMTTGEGGAIRQTTASCSDVLAFYNSPGLITKASLISN